MVTVTYTINEKLCVTVEGHAGHSPFGTDIVCASASILTYTLAKAVSKAEKERWLMSEPVIDMTDGRAVIECEPCDTFWNDMVTAYRVIVDGFHLLHNSYPKHVVVND